MWWGLTAYGLPASPAGDVELLEVREKTDREGLELLYAEVLSTLLCCCCCAAASMKHHTLGFSFVWVTGNSGFFCNNAQPNFF